MNPIDLNCDMGESFGAWTLGADEAVMPWITSANIACGYHAGDASVMRRTAEAAVRAGVALGAHVGLPDLAGFGRRRMQLDAIQVRDITVVQIGALQAVARTLDAAVVHVKPHGALYHMLEDDPQLAEAFARAVRGVDRRLRVFARASGVLAGISVQAGLAVAHEAFCDRRYGADGGLLARAERGAVLESIEAIVEQALGLARDGRVRTGQGRVLQLQADTLCIHGDREGAASIARAVHEALRQAGLLPAALPVGVAGDAAGRRE